MKREALFTWKSLSIECNPKNISQNQGEVLWLTIIRAIKSLQQVLCISKRPLPPPFYQLSCVLCPAQPHNGPEYLQSVSRDSSLLCVKIFLFQRIRESCQRAGAGSQAVPTQGRASSCRRFQGTFINLTIGLRAGWVKTVYFKEFPW